MRAQQQSEASTRRIVFLLDVDNTLLDNDRAKADVGVYVTNLVGAERAKRFWIAYEDVRREKDYVDYPATVLRWERDDGDAEAGKRIMNFLRNVPFREYVYPGAFEAINRMKEFGSPVILSDGDPDYQPLKIRSSGLADAVDGHVLVVVHKENELAQVFDAYPADHYVVVDDKSRILSALEKYCPTEFTTIFVEQGKYARAGVMEPKPDVVVSAIGDLSEYTLAQFTA